MKSILFVRPDLNSTFAQTKSLNKLGFETKIFLGINYPEKLIFNHEEVIGKKSIEHDGLFFNVLNSLINFIQFLYYSYESNYIIYYGRPPLNNLFDHFHNIKNFSFELFVLKKIFKKKLVYNPSGCNEEFLKKDFIKFDNGKVCRNCGSFDKCDDVKNQKNFDLINKYFDIKIGFGFISSNQYNQEQFKYKSIDIDLYSPNLIIPSTFKLQEFDGITIYHSNFIKESGRDMKGKNIKGSGFILNAIKKLISEGYNIRYLLKEDIPMRYHRFYQVQADICIDQLIYGSYGSTAIEFMSLGKPVISYINPKWKKHFLKNFNEHGELPIIEAHTENIYEVVKNLLDNPKKIKEIGETSREFVLKQYNPDVNSKILIEKLNSLNNTK